MAEKERVFLPWRVVPSIHADGFHILDGEDHDIATFGTLGNATLAVKAMQHYRDCVIVPENNERLKREYKGGL